MKFLGLSLLLITLTFSFSQTQTDVEINWPFFLLARNNLTAVEFNFTAANPSPTAPGQADNLDASVLPAPAAIDFATLGNFEDCLDDVINANNTFTTTTTQGPSATFGTDPAPTDDCYFKPTSVTEDTTIHSVTAATGVEDGDGWLLVVTNGSTWNVTTEVRNPGTNGLNTLMESKLYITPDGGVPAATATAVNDVALDLAGTPTTLATQAAFYQTNIPLSYVLPLQYVLHLNPLDSVLVATPNPTSVIFGPDTDLGGEDGVLADGSVTAATITGDVRYTFSVP